MSNKFKLVVGDDVFIPLNLIKVSKDNVQSAIVVNNTAVIQAALTTINKKSTLIPATSVLETNIGSDWANGLIVVKFTAGQTAAITKYGTMELEVQIDDGGKQTYFVKIPVLKSTIP